MEKYYLLVAGSTYYPLSGCGNWLGTYESEHEAQAQVREITHYKYLIRGAEYDWYRVINLKEWIYARS